MKKKELLSPAGDMESLHQAVFNGADAVYIAGYNFGARKFAKNFSKEELIEAIKFCHLYGVRIYVTMNTLIYDQEVDSFIEQARFLHKNGVDALIVQDIGMIDLLRKKFPNLEIHASTQANNSSIETCHFFHQLGVKRVVLSRELTIEEIDNIDIPIEKEVFIHGALCISYSGRCLMSSMLGGRSGNRGECAGCCRMKYSLKQNGKMIETDKYLLSTKELNTSEYFQRLLNSSIDSFKIEGRMKSPLYVGFITNFYRKIIDGEKIEIKEELDKLRIIFNREFTKGRLFHESDQLFMNTLSPNHIGLCIGKAYPSQGKIKITLDSGKTLHQNDGIRFYNSNLGMMINYLYDNQLKLCSESGNTCFIDNKIGLEKEDIVYLTQSKKLENEYIKKESIYKIPISFKVEARLGKKLRITIQDNNNLIEKFGNMIEEAQNAPTDEPTIIEKLGKIGNTPFIVEKINIEKDDNVFIQIKQINELKRELIQELIEKRESTKIEFIEKELVYPDKNHSKNINKNQYTCSILLENQLIECLKHNFIRIYVPDEDLYHKYQTYENVFFMPRKCAFSYKKVLKKRNIIDDMMILPDNKQMVGGYSLNVTNRYTAHFLKEIGLLNIPLSVELSKTDIIKFIKNYENFYDKSNFEILVYGRVENMIMKGNILQLKKNELTYELIDSKKKSFPVFFDGENTHILNHEKKQIKEYKEISSIKRLDFYNETEEEIQNLLKEIQI